MVAQWIRHLLRLTAAQSLRLCTWWIHSAVPAGKRFFPVFVFHSFVQILNINVPKSFLHLCPLIVSLNASLISEHFARFVFKNKLMGFLMNQFMNIHVSKKGPFASLSFWLLVSWTLSLLDSLPFTHSRDSCFKTAHPEHRFVRGW